MDNPAEILVTNARLLTCEDRTVIDSGAVVVSGDRIAWVGPDALVPAGLRTGATVVDAGGHTVMPGLVDPHMHISFGEAASEEELYLHTPMGYRTIRAAVDARRVLLAGVTTSCDPGGPRGIATAVRDAIDVGLIEGPRMAAAGRQMTTQQGIGDTLPAPLGDAPTSMGAIVRSRDEIIQVIRDEVKEGVDMVKVAGSGPGTTEYGAFTLDELRLITSEVHRLNRPTAIHARSRQSIADAVEAGFDWLMHASYMDAATAEKVAEQRIPIVPAMTLLVNFLEAGPGWMPQDALDGIKRELDSAVDVLGKAWRNGVSLVAGSESGFAMTPYGEWHTREIELFVDLLGMPHFDALLCMTKHAGSAIPRFGHEVGTLSPGKYADLLVIDGKPDENVKVLGQRNRLLMIMKGGEFIDLSVSVPERIIQSYERTRLYTRGLHRRKS